MIISLVVINNFWRSTPYSSNEIFKNGNLQFYMGFFHDNCCSRIFFKDIMIVLLDSRFQCQMMLGSNKL
jgi:hypothetical protein